MGGAAGGSLSLAGGAAWPRLAHQVQPGAKGEGPPPLIAPLSLLPCNVDCRCLLQCSLPATFSPLSWPLSQLLLCLVLAPLTPAQVLARDPVCGPRQPRAVGLHNGPPAPGESVPLASKPTLFLLVPRTPPGSHAERSAPGSPAAPHWRFVLGARVCEERSKPSALSTCSHPCDAVRWQGLAVGAVFPKAKVHRVDAEVGLLLRLEPGGAAGEGQGQAGEDQTRGLAPPQPEAAAFVHVSPLPFPCHLGVRLARCVMSRFGHTQQSQGVSFNQCAPAFLALGRLQVSNLSDEREEKMEKTFKRGMAVTARIIGFRPMDGIAVASCKVGTPSPGTEALQWGLQNAGE